MKRRQGKQQREVHTSSGVNKVLRALASPLTRAATAMSTVLGVLVPTSAVAWDSMLQRSLGAVQFLALSVREKFTLGTKAANTD